MKTIERRILSPDDLRNLCIEKQWYTRGSNAEYKKLLARADSQSLTAQDIADIATDIRDHSYTEYPLSGICFEIARKCYSIFEFTE